MLENLNIRTKIGLSFGLLMVLTLAVLIVVLIDANNIANINKRIASHLVPTELKLNELNLQVTNAYQAYRYESNTSEALNLIAKTSNDFQELITHVSKASDEIILTEVQSVINSAKDNLDLMTQGMESGNDVTGPYNTCKTQLIKAAEQINLMLNQEIESFDSKNGNAIAIIVGVGIGALILSVILIIYVSKIISAPIVAFTKDIIAVAEGDLSVQVEIRSGDEIGKASSALKLMVSKLRAVIGDVVVVSQNIANSSSEMNASSQVMSEGASEQASSAEEISSSMEEMASNIDQNTSNSKQTESIATEGASNITESNHLVSKTRESMQSVTAKISIIGEISRQTNLLALNAAVEAARAGEHGKGFAVVAAEIRRLAERSQEAAAEIDQVSLLGMEVAQASGDMLSAVVPEINKTAELVKEITAASVEQSSGADQINNAIQQLNKVVQQNAAVAEEMAANSQELSGQADQLKNTISFFRLDNLSKPDVQTITEVDDNDFDDADSELDTLTDLPVYSSLVVEEPKISEDTPTADERKGKNEPTEPKGIDLDLGQERDNLDSDYEKF
ncbi:MAG: HAMP domain-containing protein [Cyclobacteriaceae bacterium]